MKILMLTPYLPYPLLSGGQTRSYNLLKNLSKDHDITLFSFIRTEKERSYQVKLGQFCKKIEVFRRRPAWSPINVFLAAATAYPFLVSIYISQNVKKALERELQIGNYNLIHAETFYVMPNIPKTTVPILLVEQTIEYKVYQHFVEHSAPVVLKPLLWLDVKKVKYWEKHFWQKANRVIAMSQADKNKMLHVLPDLTVDIVPNGVYVNAFKTVVRKKKNVPIVLYVGNFKWLQNSEAAKILLQEVWPLIRQKLPNAQLWIVGRGQTTDLKLLQSQNVVFNQHVDDIRTVYQQADLMLAPIKGPGGTRLKILEAMASGCPVVTTPIGIEGIDAKDKKEVLVGNTVNELAQSAINLLTNSKLRNDLVKNAQKLVENKYSWVDITKKLDKIYKEVSYGKTN